MSYAMMAEKHETKNPLFGPIWSWLGMAAPIPSATGTTMDRNTTLSFERTFLAHERTLMAWIRTSSSLITFGFSIYKFFELEQSAGKGFMTVQVVGPREFSMILIVIGVVALVVATLQHRRQLRVLEMEYENAPASTAGLLAGLISVMGLLAIVAVFFRL
jgi:putative membrane protein